MESRRVLTQLLVVMACCLAATLARVASSMQDDNDVNIPDSLFSAKRDNNQEDISKLLLKHLRFRQLPESGSSLIPADFARDVRPGGERVGKRQEQRMLVNNLAALLSGLRDRKVESSMRMPSLRFGK